ncbi:MAG: CocE/NonD family hydrolase, partial [Solirubrobacteraceae bacterium]
EVFGAIQAAVLAVGGWADAYVDAIFRMLEHLSCPRQGLIGPWGHQWPQAGRPGPRIGFLKEAVRWWDHWLKDIDTGISDEPMLRAWMPEAVRPAPDYQTRPGRWIAEPAWPPAPEHREQLAYNLKRTGLQPTADHDSDSTPQSTTIETLSHSSDQTVGIDAGAWCAYGGPTDLPPDQRRDDALSLSLDTDPLSRRIEIFGSPTLSLRVASDQPTAFIAARLCDIAPDGASTLITRGFLNLCHHNGHDQPTALTPGRPIDVTITLKSTAYALPPGHRLRLAISTSYWPWLWPSPQPVTLTITTGQPSRLTIPTRTPQPHDNPQPDYGPPETAPPLQVTWLRVRNPIHRLELEPATGRATYRMQRDFSGARRHPSGLEYHDHDPVTFSIRDGDPLSAEVRCERRIDSRREDWGTRVELQSRMTANTTDYLISTTIDAWEGDTRIHTRTFTATIPRNHT